MAKPADFFIGVVEFFSILLPGAVMASLLQPFAGELLGSVFPHLEGRAQHWMAFLVVAYVAGHLLHAAGAPLDVAYDRAYVRWYKRRNGDDKLLLRARALMTKTLRGDSDMTSTFLWAGSFVRVKSSAAAAELERAGAESKFFRSITIVLLAMSIVSASGSKWNVFAASMPLAAFAFWRFCRRRWDHSQLAYEYYALLALPDVESETNHASRGALRPG